MSKIDLSLGHHGPRTSRRRAADQELERNILWQVAAEVDLQHTTSGHQAILELHASHHLPIPQDCKTPPSHVDEQADPVSAPGMTRSTRAHLPQQQRHRMLYLGSGGAEHIEAMWAGMSSLGGPKFHKSAPLPMNTAHSPYPHVRASTRRRWGHARSSFSTLGQPLKSNSLVASTSFKSGGTMTPMLAYSTFPVARSCIEHFRLPTLVHASRVLPLDSSKHPPF
eukprot:751028-Hanusia_phi.AAC.2